MITVPQGRADGRDLAGRMQQRDPRALAELYDRCGSALYSRLLTATGKRRTAEDLLLEIFLRAWNRIPDFDGTDGALSAWLIEIARETAPVWAEPGATPPPSPKLRRRILAAAGQPPFGWSPFLAGAALLALSAALYFGGRERTFAVEMIGLRQQMRQQDVTLTRLSEALAILNSRDAKETLFVRGPVRGRLFIDPQQGILLIASNLTPAPRGRTYEMWLVTKDGRSTPAGVFNSRPDGAVFHVDHAPVDLSSAASVSVSIENDGGAPQPGASPVLALPVH